MAEKFEVIIGAVDNASPVLQKFNKHLQTVQTTSQKAVAGLQSMADKSKWAFSAMSGAIVGAVKVFADFEDAMAKVATQLPGEAIEHYGEMSRAVQDMSITFGQSTQVMAQGLYDILSAAIPPEKALQLLEQSAKTAAAGFTDVATTADLFTSILNAYGMEVDEAARVSDVLFQSVFRGKMEFEEMATELGSIMGVAAQAGVELEDLGAIMATLTRQGISTAEAATAIRQAILSYIDPGREAQETAAALGIEFNATSLQSEGLIRSIGKLTGATQEQLTALFPNVRALIAVQGVLGDLSGAYEDLRLNMEATGVTQEAFEKATDTMKFSIDQLKSSVQVLTQEFVEAMAPAINEILDSFRGWIQVLRDIDEERKRALGEMFLTLTKMVGLVAGMNLLGKAILGIGTALGVSAGVLSPWILAIEGIIAAIVLLDHYKDRLIPFFEELGEKVGLLNEEMTEFYGHTIDLDPQIETLKKQISDTNLEIIKMEEEFIKLDEAGLFPNPEMLQRYQQLNTQLNEAQMEYDRLTAAQPDYIEGIIKEKEEVQKLRDQLEEESKALDVVIPKTEDLAKANELAAKEIENARKRLQEIASEAIWGAMIEEADAFTAQMLTVQKQFSETMNEIASMPESLAREKAAAVEAVVREYNTKMRNIEKAAFEASIKEIEAYIQQGVAIQAKANLDIIALNKAKHDKLRELEREYFEQTGRDLEVLVQKYREKYAEILNSFNWTQDEIKRIQEIAIDDLTNQLVAYVEKYIEEMQRAGASSSEIVNAVEEIILVLEKMGISVEVIERLRTEFEAMPAAIEESKEKINDLINLIGDIGDVIIDLQFGEKPTAGTIGGLVGGIIGLFSNIPTWIAGIVDLIFGWIDRIQRRTQEMIDAITGQFKSAMVDFFMEPDLDAAMQKFGQRLNEIVYDMMVDAIVTAIIASEVVQDAAKKLGQAINEYIKGGTLEGLTEAMNEFIATYQNYVLPIMAEVYPMIQAYNPYTGTAGGVQEFSGSIPSFQFGGYVPKTGLALLHEGEYVIPKEESRAISFENVEITINTTGGVDGADLWEEFEREARRRGVVLVS